MAKAKDLTGQRFGRLTVLERAPNIIYSSGSSATAWVCKCDCGNTVIIAGGHLKRKKNATKSCGCIAKENAMKQLNKIHNNELPSYKKYNNYDLSGKFGIGYIENANKNGINYFYFDLEDYNKIKNYSWHFARGYIEAWDYLNSEKKTNIRLHRLIMNCPDDLIIDHINHNTFDNRKENLRMVSDLENAWNHIPKNKYGVLGITYNKKKETYIVRITVNHKRLYIGSFKNINDAIKARKEAEVKYYGEYRYKETV